jgi:8-oxo-dGTP diphosphatase
MLYSVDGRIKIVQFWHMRAIGGPRREPMDNIKSVKWVSLKQAVEILTRAHEKVFLANVGPVGLKAARQSARPANREFTIKARGGARAPGLRQPPIDGYGTGWVERIVFIWCSVRVRRG